LHPHIIPYCLDVERYAPVADKQALRQQMGLNPELPVLLFVSEQVDNRRKGFELLLQALQQLPPDLPLQLLVVGRTTDRLADIPLPHVHLGALDEHQMAKAYQAADVFAMPSLYDNYPNTVLEAYACGLAVIGFGASGVQEMLQPMGQELTVTPYDTAEMAQKLEALVRTNRYQALGALGRAHILQHHQPATIAAAHLAYYATRSQS
jgi:glycosyltransferase involved in cell wall biosynthesis